MKRSFLQFSTALFLLLFVFGCGKADQTTPADTITPPSNGGTTTVPDVAAIQVSVDSSTISTGGTTGVTVLLLNSTGQAMPYTKTVTFSLDNPGLATITPSATTSSGSIATTLTAKTIEGTVTLTAAVDGKTASQTVQISNQSAAANVTLAANPATVTVGGTAVVSATVTDGSGNPMADGTTVNFKVDNTNLGTIVPSASISGGAGVAQATFSAGTTTSGTATITATSGSASGTTALGINGAAAGSIEFLSATPQIIVLKGAGGQETSDVQFIVNDSAGNPVVGSQTVTLTLSGPNGGEYIGTNPGDTTLDVGTVAGIASTILHSGTIPGTVTITATVKGTNLTTSSGVIAIGGGVPSAGHFSLSTTVKNLDGFEKDGLVAGITARIADRYGNYNVLQGTSVSFYSECGAIDRAVNLDANGQGSVEFRTQKPFPQVFPIGLSEQNIVNNYKDKLGVTMTDAYHPGNGLCTIVAVVDGEEEFTDGNADGIYNIGETFEDTYDDIFLDKDDSPMNVPPALVTSSYPFDPTFEDLIVDRNKNGSFNGLNGIWDSNKRIASQIKLLYTGAPDPNNPYISGISVALSGDPTASPAVPPTPLTEGDMITVSTGGSQKINFSIHDQNYNTPIDGTNFTISLDVGSLTGTTTYTYTDSSVLGAPIFSVTVSDDTPGTTDPRAGTLQFKWTYDGNEYLFSVPVTVN